MSLLTNLISFWKLDESSGTAFDAHGTNDLTDVGSAGSAAGKIGNCRTFNGSTQCLSHANNVDLTTGDIDFTVQAWFQTSSSAGLQAIVAKHDGATNAGSEWLLYADSSFVKVGVYSGSSLSTTLVATTFGTIALNTWYHVIWWHDSVANTVGLAVNGVSDTVSWSSGVNNQPAAFRVASCDSAVSPFRLTGRVDEVGLWKRLLASQERTDLYNGGSGLPFSSFGGVTPPPARPASMLMNI